MSERIAAKAYKSAFRKKVALATRMSDTAEGSASSRRGLGVGTDTKWPAEGRL